MKTEQITIYLEIRTQEGPSGEDTRLEVALLEHLEVSFDTQAQEYRVTNPKSDQWRGRGIYRQGAILNYLRDRLAIPRD